MGGGLAAIYGGTVNNDMDTPTRSPANADVVTAPTNVGIPTTLVIMILMLVFLRVVYEVAK